MEEWLVTLVSFSGCILLIFSCFLSDTRKWQSMDLCAKSGLQSVFVNKVTLEQNHTHPSTHCL